VRRCESRSLVRIHSKSHLILQLLDTLREASWTTCCRQCSIMAIINYLLSQMSLVQGERSVCSTSCNYAGKWVCFESIKVIFNAKNVSPPASPLVVQSSDCRLPSLPLPWKSVVWWNQTLTSMEDLELSLCTHLFLCNHECNPTRLQNKRLLLHHFL